MTLQDYIEHSPIQCEARAFLQIQVYDIEITIRRYCLPDKDKDIAYVWIYGEEASLCVTGCGFNTHTAKYD